MGKVVSSRYARMFGPLLDALRDAGGEGNPRELSRKVADLVVTDLAERNRLNATGTNAAENEVAWARETLKRAQLIDSSERGVWKLTDLGWKSFLTIEDAIKIRKQVSQESQQTRKQSAKFELDESDSLPESFGEMEIDQTSILDVMRSLPPKGFERLCSRLLQELGFVGVEVTGRSGDGGIDGHGLIRVNDLVSFTVIFQCKRYQGSIGSPEIRSFRGAMSGRTDKGIIISTGFFTREALIEAQREGVPPIELVDAERLVMLMEKHGLGVKPRTVYDVDRDFFAPFCNSQ